MRNIRNSGEVYLPIICSRQFVKTNEIDKGKQCMPRRKLEWYEGTNYHVFQKSIADRVQIV